MIYLQRRQECLGLFETALDIKDDHSRAAASNRFEDFMLWMRWKTWVVDTSDSVVRFEELGDSKTVLAVSLHSNVEGFETSVDEVTVKRRRYSSNSKLGKHELLFELVGFHSKETHHDVRVTIHVFCGRVHNNVGS